MIICASIREKTTDSFIKAIKEARKHVEVIEVWLDELKPLKNEDLKKIFTIKARPFIYKCKNPENIAAVLKFKPQYIDLDIETPSEIIKKIGPETTKIISYHNFKKTPSTGILKSIAKKIKEKGADIIKIAAQAKEDAIFKHSRENWKEHLLEHPQTFEISDEEVKEAEEWSKKNLDKKEQKAA